MDHRLQFGTGFRNAWAKLSVRVIIMEAVGHSIRAWRVQVIIAPTAQQKPKKEFAAAPMSSLRLSVTRM